MGQLCDLRRSLDSAAALSRKLADEVAEAGAGYDVDEPKLLASGAYTRELLETAAAAGVAMFAEDGLLLSYPSSNDRKRSSISGPLARAGRGWL